MGPFPHALFLATKVSRRQFQDAFPTNLTENPALPLRECPDSCSFEGACRVDPRDPQLLPGCMCHYSFACAPRRKPRRQPASPPCPATALTIPPAPAPHCSQG